MLVPLVPFPLVRLWKVAASMVAAFVGGAGVAPGNETDDGIGSALGECVCSAGSSRRVCLGLEDERE